MAQEPLQNDAPVIDEDDSALLEESSPSDIDDATLEVILERLVRESGHTPLQVRRTVEMLLEGSTVPFIARYRKEATGGLDEVQITSVLDRYEHLVSLEQRRAFILKTISSQEKLTPELEAKIKAASELQELEDLYLPYKPRRRTRAQKAREAGLEPLAEMILDPEIEGWEEILEEYLNDDVPDAEAALAGARDIIAEKISEDPDVREHMRYVERETGVMRAEKGKTEDPEGKFDALFDYQPRVATIPGHRILAFNRGENEGVIRVKIDMNDDSVREFIEDRFINNPKSSAGEQIRQALADGYDRLLSPQIEAEIRRELKEIADDDAIEVFTTNLRELLMAPPLGQHAVIGIDPGFRTGCKVALVDPHGDFVTHTAIYPHPPQNRGDRALADLLALIEQFGKEFPIEYIAYGNGTASRETAAFLKLVQKAIKLNGGKLDVVMVNESGASIYSASALAREEFPDLDLTVRGAISIARRIQDPLAELIKTDPKSIGVGQYQHDVDQKKLAKALGRVVESCVNSVGVQLNTASWVLLSYVSGITKRIAKNIIAHRHKLGGFTNRKQLLEVSGLGPKAYELAAGFLRIRGGDNILDNTAVHPERYGLVGTICEKAGVSLVELVSKPHLLKQLRPADFVDEASGAGLPTITDIFDELQRPGRDPRGSFEVFEYAEGVEEVSDLTPGMVLPGVITNVTNFGCFVDVGVHQDGLVHISEIANRFVEDPADEVAVGQKVRVKVLTVEPQRKRIGLSIKQAEE